MNGISGQAFTLIRNQSQLQSFRVYTQDKTLKRFCLSGKSILGAPVRNSEAVEVLAKQPYMPPISKFSSKLFYSFWKNNQLIWAKKSRANWPKQADETISILMLGR